MGSGAFAAFSVNESVGANIEVPKSGDNSGGGGELVNSRFCKLFSFGTIGQSDLLTSSRVDRFPSSMVFSEDRENDRCLVVSTLCSGWGSTMGDIGEYALLGALFLGEYRGPIAPPFLDKGRSLFLSLLSAPEDASNGDDDVATFAGWSIRDSLLFVIGSEREEAYESGFTPRRDCDRDRGVREASTGSSLFLLRERLDVEEATDISAESVESAECVVCERSLRDAGDIPPALRLRGEGLVRAASCSFLDRVARPGVMCDGVNDSAISASSFVCICDCWSPYRRGVLHDSP
jgi:hypothetical protein